MNLDYQAHTLFSLIHFMARVSVIIPSYNSAFCVSDAINSALNQKFDDIEIIVVDDGSTDSTQDVLQKYRSASVRVISQVNKGLLGARRTGILESSAPLLYFLDADDALLPGSLHLLFSILDSHPEIGLVTGGTEYVDSDGRKLGLNISRPKGLDVDNLLLNNPITVSGVMVRRHWFDMVGGFDTRRIYDPTGDWDLWLRLAYAGCKIEWVEKPIVAYRIHPSQMTQDPGRMRDAMFLVLDKFYTNDKIPKRLEDLKPKAYGNVFVKSACRYFLAGMMDKGMDDFSQAIRTDPSLCKDESKELMDMLIGWAQSAQSKDPVVYLENIKHALPDYLKQLEKPLKKAIALVILKPLFDGGRQVWLNKKREIVKAIRNDISWLLNRGVIRMLFESWILHFRR